MKETARIDSRSPLIPVTTMSIPQAIARSLYACSSNHKVRKSLYHTMSIEVENDVTTLAATDTNILCIAAKMEHVADAGVYCHIQKPRGARLMMQKIDTLFPDWKHVIPVKNLATIGEFSGVCHRLAINSFVSMDHRFLDRLLPTEYRIEQDAEPNYGRNGGRYKLTGEYQGWMMTYVIMGMTTQIDVMPTSPILVVNKTEESPA